MVFVFVFFLWWESRGIGIGFCVLTIHSGGTCWATGGKTSATTGASTGWMWRWSVRYATRALHVWGDQKCIPIGNATGHPEQVTHTTCCEGCDELRLVAATSRGGVIGVVASFYFFGVLRFVVTNLTMYLLQMLVHIDPLLLNHPQCSRIAFES